MGDAKCYFVLQPLLVIRVHPFLSHSHLSFAPVHFPRTLVTNGPPQHYLRLRPRRDSCPRLAVYWAASSDAGPMCHQPPNQRTRYIELPVHNCRGCAEVRFGPRLGHEVPPAHSIGMRDHRGGEPQYECGSSVLTVSSLLEGTLCLCSFFLSR